MIDKNIVLEMINAKIDAIEGRQGSNMLIVTNPENVVALKELRDDIIKL